MLIAGFVGRALLCDAAATAAALWAISVEAIAAPAISAAARREVLRVDISAHLS